MTDAATFERAFRGRTVLLTGHTGFKGAWLSLWLASLGARVVGVALPPAPGGIFEAARVGDLVDSRLADIRDAAAFEAAVAGVRPDILVHMAAQALVRPSYAQPVETFATNVVGTAVVLDAARRMETLRAILVVTSDKCYENADWVWGYRETDPMGGADPYSASKGCTELVASAYRRSFFAGSDAPALATARAGNVFGGGDVSADRLVPDLLRAFAAGAPAAIRNPRSVRPWQHVLEPLAGYLRLCAGLLTEGAACAGAWNFGPDADGIEDVATLAGRFAAAWGPSARLLMSREVGPPEATTLRLDSTKARTLLGWRPCLTAAEAVELTVAWHKAAAVGADLLAHSLADLDRFGTNHSLDRAA